MAKQRTANRLLRWLIATAGIVGWNVGLCSEELPLGSHESLASFQEIGIDEECRDLFLREGPNGWRFIRDNLRGYEVDVSHTEQWLDGSQRHEDASAWRLTVPSMAESQNALVSEQHSLKVTARNKRYAFQVLRDAVDKPYVVSHVKPSLMRDDPNGIGPLRYTDTLLQTGCSIWWVPCQSILDHLGVGGFEMTHAQFVRDADGGRRAQIMFRYRGETGAMPACHTNAVYWGVFAPEDHWLVIRSGVSDVSSGAERLRIRVNATYQSWRGKSLFPKEIVLAYESRPDGRIVEVRRTSFGIPENSTSVGEEQFYLPHYGISEAAVPTFVDRGRGYRIALNAIAVILLLIAVLFWRYGRRVATR